MKKVCLNILWLVCCAATLSAQTVVQQFAAVSAGAGTVSDMDLIQPTAEGSVLLAMPEQLTPGIKVETVTDNAPDGGNKYQKVTAAASSCASRSIEIWYCEKCKGGVTELKFHLSGHVRASINGFMEVSGVALSDVLDGSGAQVSDAAATKDGQQVGPKITTKATDFVIARYSTTSRPSAVSLPGWTFKTTYVYGTNLPPGTYQPALTGGKTAGSFCMSMAAFKAGPASADAKPQN
jgi:hypothetical protein